MREIVCLKSKRKYFIIKVFWVILSTLRKEALTLITFKFKAFQSIPKILETLQVMIAIVFSTKGSSLKKRKKIMYYQNGSNKFSVNHPKTNF